MVRRNSTRSLAVILIHPDGPPPAGGVHPWRPIRKPAPSASTPNRPVRSSRTNCRRIVRSALTAIFSFICGVVAIFAGPIPIFYLASILAVVLGILAHRAIRQHPDMLTGHGLANTGIALGLAFGLAACNDFDGAVFCLASAGGAIRQAARRGRYRQISVIRSNSRHLQTSGRGRANSSLSKSSK